MSFFERYHEIPPTAGLPVSWWDWLPTREKLNQTISKFFNLPPLQVTCSGTAALIIALKTLAKNHPQRKYVIAPAYTCPLVALAIHHCGLKIKLCDLATNSIDFDFHQLESSLDEQVLAIIVTHLGGRVANVAHTKKLADTYGIKIIEDAAQALGADVGVQGDIAFFSLAAGKGLTLYEGGLLTAKTPEIQEQLIQTAQQAIPSNLLYEIKRIIELMGYTALYNPTGLYWVYGQPRRKALNEKLFIEAVGDNFDFDIPLHQVSQFRQKVATRAASRLPTFLAKTKAKALSRIEQLNALPGINILTDTNNTTGVWPFLMVLLPSKAVRDNILNQLWQSPLGVSRLFIHALPNYSYLSTIVPQTHMPNAVDFSERMLTITNSLWLDDQHFSEVLQAIQANLN